MNDLGETGQRERGAVGKALTWGGVSLLVIGGVLVYPYVDSRLAAIPPTAIPTPTEAASPTSPPATPLPTETSVPPTSTPLPSPTPVPAPPERIVIPSLGVDAPVVPVSWEEIDIDGQSQAAWQVPGDYAAGWHDTSAPLGVPGNTVLNGHNTTNGEVFRDLYTLDPGETIAVHSGGLPYTYTVSQILILPEAGQPLEVRLENARYIMPTEDERLTLVTCHPYGSLRYRLIVIAYPQDRPSEGE